jgi:predicted nuclease of predicted toxin-antitoxin system
VRLICDENVPWPLVSALRDDGHDVFAVMEAMRSEPDTVVLREAVQQQRVLVTFDRDFGEMIFARRSSPPVGVILVRPVLPTLAETILLVRTVIMADFPPIIGNFVVIDRKTRYHPLSSA